MLAGQVGHFISVGGGPAYRGYFDPSRYEPPGLPAPVREDAATSSEDDDGNAGSQGPERQQERPQAFDRNAAVATIEAAWSEHYKGTAADWAQSVGFDLKQETRDGLIHLLQDVQAGTVRGADGLRK